MTYTLGRSAAAALLPAALTMRLFWGMSVDYTQAMNASWICPLLGFAIYLPIAFAITVADEIDTGSTWDNITGRMPKGTTCIAELLLAFLLLYDCAVAVRLMASSSNLIALKDVTVHLLVIPLTFVVAAVVKMGGDAAGHSARIWLRILPFFAVIMLLVQVKSYRIGWLAPLLGGGIGTILSGSIYCAGNMALLSLLWMIAVPDRNQKSIFRYCAYSVLVACILLLIQGMSYPAMSDIAITRAARIELILSNGRMSLSPQLLLDVLWYGGLLYLVAAEVVCAAYFIKRCFVKLPVGVIAAAEAILISLAALYDEPVLRYSALLSSCSFVIIGALLALMLCAAYFLRRHKANA